MVDHAQIEPDPETAFQIFQELLEPLLIQQLVVGVVEGDEVKGEFPFIEIGGQGAPGIGDQAAGPEQQLGFHGLLADVVIDDRQGHQRQQDHGEGGGDGLLPQQPEIEQRFVHPRRLIVMIEKSGFKAFQSVMHGVLSWQKVDAPVKVL